MRTMAQQLGQSNVRPIPSNNSCTQTGTECGYGQLGPNELWLSQNQVWPDELWPKPSQTNCCTCCAPYCGIISSNKATRTAPTRTAPTAPTRPLPDRPKFRAFFFHSSLSWGVFSWNFGGVCECRVPLMCTLHGIGQNSLPTLKTKSGQTLYWPNLVKRLGHTSFRQSWSRPLAGPLWERQFETLSRSTAVWTAIKLSGGMASLSFAPRCHFSRKCQHARTSRLQLLQPPVTSQQHYRSHKRHQCHPGSKAPLETKNTRVRRYDRQK